MRLQSAAAPPPPAPSLALAHPAALGTRPAVGPQRGGQLPPYAPRTAREGVLQDPRPPRPGPGAEGLCDVIADRGPCRDWVSAQVPVPGALPYGAAQANRCTAPARAPSLRGPAAVGSASAPLPRHPTGHGLSPWHRHGNCRLKPGHPYCP